MRPGQLRPGNIPDEALLERLELASMRPGQLRPGNYRDVAAPGESLGAASMRPGQLRPGNGLSRPGFTHTGRGFNEAGAASPRKLAAGD